MVLCDFTQERKQKKQTEYTYSKSKTTDWRDKKGNVVQWKVDEMVWIVYTIGMTNMPKTTDVEFSFSLNKERA